MSDNWRKGPSERLRLDLQRCEDQRLTVVRSLFSGLIGGSRAGAEEVIRLPAGAPITEVTATAWKSLGSNYSRRCSYPMSFASFRVTIPADYEATVLAAGLQNLHGMPTIAALKVSDTGRPGEEAWRAKWVAKIAGFNFRVEDG